MTRLIDADELEYFRCNDNKCDSGYDVKCQTCEYAIIPKYIIDNAPTVEERPKGEWVQVGKYHYQCAICEYNDIVIKTNFCPNCGADMRGADND